jgi:lipoic acid synthetase
MTKWGRDIPQHLRHLADHAGAPARQEATTLVAAMDTPA